MPDLLLLVKVLTLLAMFSVRLTMDLTNRGNYFRSRYLFRTSYYMRRDHTQMKSRILPLLLPPSTPRTPRPTDLISKSASPVYNFWVTAPIYIKFVHDTLGIFVLLTTTTSQRLYTSVLPRYRHPFPPIHRNRLKGALGFGV